MTRIPKKYELIADLLREGILRGDFQEQLPSIDELTSQFRSNPEAIQFTP